MRKAFALAADALSVVFGVHLIRSSEGLPWLPYTVVTCVGVVFIWLALARWPWEAKAEDAK